MVQQVPFETCITGLMQINDEEPSQESGKNGDQDQDRDNDRDEGQDASRFWKYRVLALPTATQIVT